MDQSQESKNPRKQKKVPRKGTIGVARRVHILVRWDEPAEWAVGL